jgi:hypothetical protein
MPAKRTIAADEIEAQDPFDETAEQGDDEELTTAEEEGRMNVQLHTPSDLWDITGSFNITTPVANMQEAVEVAMTWKELVVDPLREEFASEIAERQAARGSRGGSSKSSNNSNWRGNSGGGGGRSSGSWGGGNRNSGGTRGNPDSPISDAQIGLIKKLAREADYDLSDEPKPHTNGEADTLIKKLKAMKGDGNGSAW